jgi:hypothetical protein
MKILVSRQPTEVKERKEGKEKRKKEEKRKKGTSIPRARRISSRRAVFRNAIRPPNKIR